MIYTLYFSETSTFWHCIALNGHFGRRVSTRPQVGRNKTKGAHKLDHLATFTPGTKLLGRWVNSNIRSNTKPKILATDHHPNWGSKTKTKDLHSGSKLKLQLQDVKHEFTNKTEPKISGFRLKTTFQSRNRNQNLKDKIEAILFQGATPNSRMERKKWKCLGTEAS